MPEAERTLYGQMELWYIIWHFRCVVRWREHFVAKWSSGILFDISDECRKWWDSHAPYSLGDHRVQIVEHKTVYSQDWENLLWLNGVLVDNLTFQMWVKMERTVYGQMELWYIIWHFRWVLKMMRFPCISLEISMFKYWCLSFFSKVNGLTHIVDA